MCRLRREWSALLSLVFSVFVGAAACGQPACPPCNGAAAEAGVGGTGAASAASYTWSGDWGWISIGIFAAITIAGLVSAYSGISSGRAIRH